MEYPVSMKYLALLTLVAIIVVGVFGFAGMSHDMSHGDSGCIASVMNGSVVCPQDVFSSALYHIAAYKDLSQAAMTSSLLSVVILLLLAALAIAEKRYPIPIAPSSQYLLLRRDELSVPRREKFLRWLAFFQHSPSFVRGA